MLQAYYDVDLDAAGTVGAGRKAGTPVELALEVGHLAGTVDSDKVTAATLETRVAGGEWTPVKLAAGETDAPSGPVDPGPDDFVESRAFVSAYVASISAPDAGAWIDLRVTATDAAGNTFSQEIVRAFEVAPAKAGAAEGPARRTLLSGSAAPPHHRPRRRLDPRIGRRRGVVRACRAHARASS